MYLSPVREVYEFKESTPYVGVSEWRCRKLKRERGRTCRSWNKEREEKGKNGNMESGKIGVHARRCFGHTWWCCRWQGRQNQNEGGWQWGELRTMSKHDDNKTSTKMVGGYRRRWWSEKMVAEVEELRTWLKGCTMLLTMPWINLILLSSSSFPSPLIQSTLPSSDHALSSSSFCPGRSALHT